MDHRKYSLNYCYKMGCRCFHCKSKHRVYYKSQRKFYIKLNQRYAEEHKGQVKKYKRRWYNRNRTELHHSWRKKKYNLTAEAYEKLHNEQHGQCKICLAVPSHSLFVDHCHATKKVRGLLCRNCNFAIGLFQDNPSILLQAAKYLKRG